MTRSYAKGDEILEMLEESRRREKRQTLFYRTLAAEAEWAERLDDSERFNELHADEQHHLSRLTARLLELGGEPDDLRGLAAPEVSLDGWKSVARDREVAEVEWYQRLLERDLDDGTRAVVSEILESELHHRDELQGKWMSA